MECYALTIDDKAYKNEGCCYAIYLHGKIDHINGFDCVLMPELPEKDGVYSITVYLVKEKTYPCILYFWHTKDYSIPKGLICLEGDSEANEQARHLYNIKSESLNWQGD